MYVGIDIGGTKTLVATLSDEGKIISGRRFPSDHDYLRFLDDLGENLKQLQISGQPRACAGIPGLLDREKGIVRALGNLPWKDKPIRDDISKLLGGAKVLIENDSRLAGLSEARLIMDKYDDILFATISTGIGGAFIQKGRIVRALQDTEMGKMPLEHDGELIHWEEFAGGRSVVKRFNQQAHEINDPASWRVIGENIAYGLGAVCSIIQPEVIILGGSVGAQADKYSGTIMEFLAKHLHPVVRQPQAILPAQRPDEAVIYGCYDLAKQVFEDGKTDN
ncbi:MAG TPA: ROK family protein [Candidatus Dormibacteraeota bacterium]|nr:ROK family protein [Candidatus Dormibacteraeota bacterium]